MNRNASMAKIGTVLGVVALMATLGTAPTGEAEEQERIVFSMNAQHVGTGGGGMTPITIVVEGWSTPEHRDALEQIIIDDGMQAPGVEFRYDEESDTLSMARVSSQPIRLNDVTMRIEGQ